MTYLSIQFESMQPNISVYFDSRRKKDNNKYPVKLRVYFQGETRYYSAGKDLTKDQFKLSFLADMPRGGNREIKDDILAKLNRAKEISKKIDPFTFDRFEKTLLRPTGSGTDVLYQYERMIKERESNGQVNTSINYQQSLNSIKRFLEKRRRSSRLSFDMITRSFLDEYESWMFQAGKQTTTVGIYLRPLRALFNQAVAAGDIPHESYPFGKGKYEIPKGRNIKKALSKDQLAALYNYSICQDSHMAKARDFWFFSYVCNGMNVRDIAELKYKNISDSTISFIRTKTKNTTKANQKPIIAVLSIFAAAVIKKYGNKKITGDTYVFPVLKASMTEKEKVRRVQLFTKYINQHLKKLAQLAGVNSEISTYWARHSFTTIAIHNGASLEFIQDSLGHQNMATTMNYWKGFEENVKKDISEKLMNF